MQFFDCNFRVCPVGQPSAGKTSLLNRYFGLGYQELFPTVIKKILQQKKNFNSFQDGSF